MKITKRQLRRIIKEEKRKLLSEQKVRYTVRRRLAEGAVNQGAIKTIADVARDEGIDVVVNEESDAAYDAIYALGAPIGNMDSPEIGPYLDAVAAALKAAGVPDADEITSMVQEAY